MAHTAWGSHAPCVKYHRPFDGSMMYTGIDCEYNSYVLTSFHLTLNYPLILTQVISTAGPNHIDCCDSNLVIVGKKYSSQWSISFDFDKFWAYVICIQIKKMQECLDADLQKIFLHEHWYAYTDPNTNKWGVAYGKL